MNNRRPLCLHTDMTFGPQMPCVVLAGQTHLGIPVFATVVLAHRRSQQGRIHAHARFEHKPMRV